jgi:hypothetical protein
MISWARVRGCELRTTIAEPQDRRCHSVELDLASRRNEDDDPVFTLVAAVETNARCESYAAAARSRHDCVLPRRHRPFRRIFREAGTVPAVRACRASVVAQYRAACSGDIGCCG